MLITFPYTGPRYSELWTHQQQTFVMKSICTPVLNTAHPCKYDISPVARGRAGAKAAFGPRLWQSGVSVFSFFLFPSSPPPPLTHRCKCWHNPREPCDSLHAVCSAAPAEPPAWAQPETTACCSLQQTGTTVTEATRWFRSDCEVQRLYLSAQAHNLKDLRLLWNS